MIEFQEARRVAGMLAAVAEANRLRVLLHLTRGPHHVGQLAALLGVPMVNMSHHLGVLRQAGLLDDAKDGRRVVYSLRPDVYTPGGGPDAIGTLRIGTYSLTLLRAADGAGARAVKRRPRRKPPAK
jgi:ArsR family transcriptional regulator